MEVEFSREVDSLAHMYAGISHRYRSVFIDVHIKGSVCMRRAVVVLSTPQQSSRCQIRGHTKTILSLISGPGSPLFS